MEGRINLRLQGEINFIKIWVVKKGLYSLES
jgi:hypothetical protein